MAKSFLTAEWRKLAIANYAVDKNVLAKYIPSKTEIDLWNDTCYLSLVGFMFLNTKLKGLSVPFHQNFEEVNLRFYVKHKNAEGKWRRGVSFIKEFVPRYALTFVARTVYGENYETVLMKHSWESQNGELLVDYKWKKKEWNNFHITAESSPVTIKDKSEEEFITEHYWGYTRINEKKTSEYEVEHPRWEVYPVKNYFIDVDFKSLYGQEFDFLGSAKPQSVFLAEGSLIRVKGGVYL